MDIRVCSTTSAPELARIHAESLEESFLATLGQPFLRQLYRAMAEDPSVSLFCAVADDRIVGFVSGGTGLKKIYLRLLKRPFSLLWSLRYALLSKTSLKGIIEILFYSPKPASEPVEKPAIPSQFELYSIGVSEEFRGTGIAVALYSSLVADFESRGAAQFKVMVGEKLERAHRFYKKMGATPTAILNLHGSNNSVLYIHNLK